MAKKISFFLYFRRFTYSSKYLTVSKIFHTRYETHMVDQIRQQFKSDIEISKDALGKATFM